MSLTNDALPTAATVQVVTPEGKFHPSPQADEYLSYLERLGEEDYRQFYRDMVQMRVLDSEGFNLQRQGQMGLWVPSRGQEGAQVGSARAARAQDNIFPSYREHVVGIIRGIDPVQIMALLRGVTLGGWDPKDPAVGRFHLYTMVIGSQVLHATGYAMGVKRDGACGSGDPDQDEAVLVYFGDGSTSQGDVSEAFVFAASYHTPQVFFLQNNQWAISVPVTTQARTPLYLRSSGFGIPGVQVDGNDVLASYAVAAKHLDEARSGEGPSLIEAVTYRMGPHTSSDDPTKYRTRDEEALWQTRDPIVRFRVYLEKQGIGSVFFDNIDQEAHDFAADVRRRVREIEPPVLSEMFDHVYSEPHPVIDEQRQWVQQYEASFGEAV